MATNTVDQCSNNGDREKRVRRRRKNPNVRKAEGFVESDEEPLLPSSLVHVEMMEASKTDRPLDFSLTSAKEIATPDTNLKRPRKCKEKKLFTCKECDMNFEAETELMAHSTEHFVESRYQCKICDRAFLRPQSLKVHMHVHKEKIERCPICGLMFSYKNHKTMHMKTHERTEKCEQCTAAFHTKQELEAHAISHTLPEVPEHTNKFPKTKNNPIVVTSKGSVLTAEILVMIEPESDPEPPHPNEYQDLDYASRCSIVSKIHKGRSITDICKLYNTTPQVINEIWEERDKYILDMKAGKRTTNYLTSILESKVYDWYKIQQANKVRVNGRMFQNFAETVAKEIGYFSFNGSSKWLERFKKKHNITLRLTPRVIDQNAESKMKEHFFREQWNDLRQGVPDDNIYTADEVGLYYNTSKGRVKKLTGKKYILGSVKDRLSIFMCTNASGTDKRKLMVCGSEDPLIRSYRDPDTLPVKYIRHKEAHFTTKMFEDYVKSWNKQLAMSNRIALLVVDRATIHSKLHLSHLKLIFVPWKASTSLMPIKNGVFNRFKEEFRILLLEEKAMNAYRGVDRNVTCLEALSLLEKAWDRTPADVIFESFRTMGFDVKNKIEKAPPIPRPVDNTEEMLCKMLEDFDVEPYFTDQTRLDLYLSVNDELLTGQGTNGSVFGGNHKVRKMSEQMKDDEAHVLPIGTEKPESKEGEVMVRKTRALEDLEIVRRYLQSQNTSYETFCSFMEVEKFVFDKQFCGDS